MDNCEDHTTDIGFGPGFEFVATSCQGQQPIQKDVYVVIPYFEDNPGSSPSSFFALFDGNDGVEVSTFAAKYLPDYIRENEKYQQGNIVQGLKDSFLLLDRSILWRESINELREMRRVMHPNIPELTPGFTSGSAAMVCLLKNEHFYCANIGELRCFLFRNGCKIPLSCDLKPEDPLEMERIEKAGGTVIDGRINMQMNVSRSFGHHMYKCNPDLTFSEQMIIALPDVIVEPFTADPWFLVMMCPGIWKSIDNDKLINYIHRRITRAHPLRDIAEKIIQKILSIENNDNNRCKENMTLIIVKSDNQEIRKRSVSSTSKILNK